MWSAKIVSGHDFLGSDLTLQHRSPRISSSSCTQRFSGRSSPSGASPACGCSASCSLPRSLAAQSCARAFLHALAVQIREFAEACSAGRLGGRNTSGQIMSFIQTKFLLNARWIRGCHLFVGRRRACIGLHCVSVPNRRLPVTSVFYFLTTFF